MIIGTCGHRIDRTNKNSLGFPIAIKDYDKEGNEVISFLIVCKDCLKWYQKENLIIKEKK
jgi:hypothetical protein